MPTHDLAILRSRMRRFFAVVRLPRSKNSAPRVYVEPQLQRPLPSLPPELWIIIIREATAATLHPDPLDTTHAISFVDSPHSYSHLHLRVAHYRACMRQKLNMTLVCKLWNEISQEIMYEYVWISRASQAKALASSVVKGGRYIRRLHIETPPLERCSPVDLRTILDHATRLIVYSDYRSVRRSFDSSCDTRSSPEQLFSALTHPNNSLRRLSWTNYDGVAFHLQMSPMLEATADHLEFLELTFCSPHLHSMVPSRSTPPPASTISLTLPALRSLKVTLDNATFSVLSTWSMPVLQNLSVLSVDFSYAGSGFSQFFIIHGPKLIQLELGHSSSIIEEHYLTMPSTNQTIPLAEWCPNLREFICSADAEWNWQSPDWIAPHVLLPNHPRLQFIGIRDIDKRLLDDISLSPHADMDDDAPFFMLLQQIGSLLREAAFPGLLYIRDMSWGSDVMRTGVGRPGGQGRRISRFWGSVLEICKTRGVWLEDCRGINVTTRDLRRAEAGVVNVSTGPLGAWDT